MSFEFIKLKQKFFFDTYKLLLEHNWRHYIIVYEGDPDYYTIVLLAFKDEKGYFRKMEMPLPILQKEAEGEFKELAKHLLDMVNNNAENVKRVPREIWGKVPVRDLYEMIRKP